MRNLPSSNPILTIRIDTLQASLFSKEGGPVVAKWNPVSAKNWMLETKEMAVGVGVYDSDLVVTLFSLFFVGEKGIYRR